jgi:adenosylcobyric acid synthase
MQNLKPLMLAGTGSDVGKSVLATAFCRIFHRMGYNPAPFKAQNMSLNSYATPEGLEIGRAQAVQAEACGIPCSVHMNPILLKPTGEQSSQVVLRGKPLGTQTTREYFTQPGRGELFATAMESYHFLAKHHNPMIIEGAGSISEINLWDKDITNMRVALALNAPVILVADIDRGGVFASIYGTIALLPPQQKELIKGVIINKFRGDLSLFADARQIIENLTGKPLLGVVPWFHDIQIEQEDSVVLKDKNRLPHRIKPNVAVVALPHMSNFTDFQALEKIPHLNLYYAWDAETLQHADVMILPGSKNTMADLLYLRQKGLDQLIMQHHQAGKQLYGICGGYQMMGQQILDPWGVEGNIPSMEGLGVLPVTTTLHREKKTVQSEFVLWDGSTEGKGYEIHMGKTVAEQPAPFARMSPGDADGYRLSDNTWGTYLHGVFDNSSVIKRFMGTFLPADYQIPDYRAVKEQSYDKLAEHVSRHTDMETIRKIMQYD